MQCISIQIDPSHSQGFDREKFLAQTRQVDRAPEIDSYEEKGKTYLFFNFFTEFPHQLWKDLRAALYDHSDYSAVISPVSMAVYDDEDTPNEYLLLHHFNPNEPLDQLP